MSLKSAAQAVAAAMLAAFALNAGAQQPNPLDNVPDKMPNDFPYGTPISLDRAEAAINAAVAESRKRGWKLNVAVVDSGGNLVAFQRMDGAQLASIAISEHKARAAATRSSQFLVVRRDTAALRPFSIAISALAGVAPSMRSSHSRCPPSSRTAMTTFHLFLRASASQAAPIFLQSSSVRQGLVFIAPT